MFSSILSWTQSQHWLSSHKNLKCLQRKSFLYPHRAFILLIANNDNYISLTKIPMPVDTTTINDVSHAIYNKWFNLSSNHPSLIYHAWHVLWIHVASIYYTACINVKLAFLLRILPAKLGWWTHNYLFMLRTWYDLEKNYI